MLPKPAHLGPEYAAQFQDQSVVAAYQYRPPYPAETFSILADLITDAPRAVLAIVYDEQMPNPWDATLREIIRRYSTNRKFQPYSTLEELARRGLFQQQGQQRTAPVPFTQSVNDYIESFHARNGFSRQRMRKDEADGFDAEVKALLAGSCPTGEVTLQVTALVVWGKPGTPR